MMDEKKRDGTVDESEGLIMQCDCMLQLAINLRTYIICVTCILNFHLEFL